MSITVYGSSDDLVEVEGDIEEEFTYGSEPLYLGFSNGVVLRVEYMYDGVWEIRNMFPEAAVLVRIVSNRGADSDDYSDRAELGASASWVVAGENFTRA